MVFNSAVIVFREGLEAILIFAAVTASLLGANEACAARRSPPAPASPSPPRSRPGFVAQAMLGRCGAARPAPGGRSPACIAIAVLLVVMNWFFHNVYWTQWIGRHHRQRRKVLAAHRAGRPRPGLVALGFTSVYREGFESVLFLQNLQIKAGSSAVLEGVGFGLAATCAVGLVTFKLQQKLPYRRMLIATGVLVGVVLVVMIGGTALSFQQLGWLPSHPTPFTIPEWMRAWFEIVLDLGDTRRPAARRALRGRLVLPGRVPEGPPAARPPRRGRGAPSGHPAGQRGLTTDIVGCVVDDAELERELNAVGRRLWKGLPSSARRPLKALDDKAMAMASSDAELKAALFRFVDVVPACRQRRRPRDPPHGLPARGRGAAAADRRRHEDGQLARRPGRARPRRRDRRQAHGAPLHRRRARRRPRWATCASSWQGRRRELRRPARRGDRHAARRRSATRSAARRRSRPLVPGVREVARPPPARGRLRGPAARATNLSVKVSALDAAAAPRGARARSSATPPSACARLLRQARESHARPPRTCTSTRSRWTPATPVLELVLELLAEEEFREGPSAGMVLQAYLRDSARRRSTSSRRG